MLHRDEGPRPSIGVLFAELFLVLSVLSKSADHLRLPALSNLHLFPIIGSGASFVARKVEREYVLDDSPTIFPDHKAFVYKSIRHFKQGQSTSHMDGGIARLRNLLIEVQVLAHAPLRSHENIVKLIGFGWELNRIDRAEKISVSHWPFVVLEYAPWGGINRLFEEENVKFKDKKSLCLDVGRGLAALHACDIIHGDIKLENILVFPHSSRGYVAKLADFGFTMVDLDGNAGTSFLRGRTYPWDAPESEQRMDRHSLKMTDVYSYGFLIWRCMCYGHYPFTENEGGIKRGLFSELIGWKRNDKLLEVAVASLKCIIPNDIRDSIKTALTHSLRHNPQDRDLQLCLGTLGYVLLSFSLFFCRTFGETIPG